MTHKIHPKLYEALGGTEVADLYTLPVNPREGSDIPSIMASLDQLGQVEPLLAAYDEHPDAPKGKKVLVVQHGNHRLKAARNLGWTHVAILDVSDLSPEQLATLVLSMNRTADKGGYDAQALSAVYETIHDDNLLAATGWDDDEMADVLANIDLELPTLDDHDSIGDGDPEPEGPPDGTIHEVLDVSIGEPARTVKRGDVWKLGRHTLVCETIATGWPSWNSYLTEGVSLIPYGSPFVAPVAKDDVTMLIIQPDYYLAGHILDKWDSVAPKKHKAQQIVDGSAT